MQSCRNLKKTPDSSSNGDMLLRGESDQVAYNPPTYENDAVGVDGVWME